MTLGQAILELFDDPSVVWQAVFDNSLDALAQRTLLALATLPEPVDLDELDVVVRAQAETPPLVSLDPTLKALDDTFVSIGPHTAWVPAERRYEQADRAVSFRNPGLLDFAQDLIESVPSRLQALEPLARFEQVHEVLDLATSMSGGTPEYPRTRAYVSDRGEQYARAAVRLFPTEPCLLGGSRRTARLAALTRVAQRLRPFAGDVLPDLLSTVADAWHAGTAEPVDLVFADYLAGHGVADLLREALGEDPIAAIARVAAAAEPSLDAVQILERLRVIQDLGLDEDLVRGQFDDYLRQRMNDLDDEGDHDTLRAELRQLEDLDYWAGDDVWAQAVEAFETRIAETSPPEDDYEEKLKDGGSPDAAPSDTEGDEYLGALFATLADPGDEPAQA